MSKNKNVELDYLILSNIVNSEETEEDIVLMVTRFISLRFQSQVLDKSLGFAPINKDIKKC